MDIFGGRIMDKEIEQLKAENERLKYELYVALKEKDRWNSNCNTFYNICKKQNKILQDIKAIAETGMHCEGMGCDFMPKILDLITKAEEEC